MTRVLTEASCWRRIGTAPGGDRSCARLQQLGRCAACEVYQQAGRTLQDHELSASDLQAAARAIAAPRDGARLPDARCLLARVGRGLYGLPAGICQRVRPMAEVRRVPHRCPALLGVLPHDGHLLPCVDLGAVWHERAEASAVPSAARRIVIVRLEPHEVALLVDEVIGMHAYRQHELAPPPACRAGGSRNAAGTIETPQGAAGLLQAEALRRAVEERLQ